MPLLDVFSNIHAVGLICDVLMMSSSAAVPNIVASSLQLCNKLHDMHSSSARTSFRFTSDAFLGSELSSLSVMQCNAGLTDKTFGELHAIATKPVTGMCPAQGQQGQGMRDADLLVWLGDFNYRIDVTYELAKEKIRRNCLDELMEQVLLPGPASAVCDWPMTASNRAQISCAPCFEWAYRHDCLQASTI